MSTARASLLAAAAAVTVYFGSLGNRFALDDVPIVEHNPAAHSLPAAALAFGQPYWPAEHGAGQWRPLVIVSFAIDWSLSRGSAAWLHTSNVLWHAAATGLLVVVIAGYVQPAAALVGGVLFAVHPVHVEAVANLVGRAELMAASWIFAAVLLARAVRRRRAARLPSGWVESLLLASVAAALLSKEHAAVAPAVLALDDAATRRDLPAGLPWRDYAGMLAVASLWLAVRRHVEGGLSFETVAPIFFRADSVERISTMLPVVFVLVRLLLWPFDSSPDYNPRVVERFEHPTLPGVAGLGFLLAVLALALLMWPRRRAVSTGLLLIGIAWLPTANLLFPTGIVIAERALYLASAGLALAASAAAASLLRHRGAQTTLLLTTPLVLVLAGTTMGEVPLWKDNRSRILSALVGHPESYWIHRSAARAFVRLGEPEPALGEYRVAIELYPLDHYLLTEMAGIELAARRTRPALRNLRRSELLDSTYTLTQQLMAQALLALGSARSALPHARAAVRLAPRRAAAAQVLTISFLALGLRDSALAVWPEFAARGGSPFERWLFQSSTYAAIGLLGDARTALDSARARLPRDSSAVAQFRQVEALVRQPPPSVR